MYRRVGLFVLAAAFVCATSVYAQKEPGPTFFSRDRGVGPVSTDPIGDINEVAVAFGRLYGFDGRKFGAAMTGVFAVECGLRQTCGNSPSGQHSGSFQHGAVEISHGLQLLRKNIPAMLQQGAITPEQNQRFLAALQNASNSGRGICNHHLVCTLIALARNAEIAGPLQTAVLSIQQQAAGHMTFQFASSIRDRIILGRNGGLAGPRPNFASNCELNTIPSRVSILQSIDFIARSKKCGPKLQQGIAAAIQQTGIAAPPFDPSTSFFGSADNERIFNQVIHPSNQTQPTQQNPFFSAFTQNTPFSQPANSGGQIGQATPSAPAANAFYREPYPAGTPVPTQAELQTQLQGVVKNITQATQQTEGREVPAETEAEDVASVSCVGGDERAQVRWSCVSGSSVSQGTASPKDTTFSTRGALAGVVTVSPREVTTYTVSCIKNKEVLGSASCKLKPPGEKGTTRMRAMVLSIAPESEVVRRGKRARLSWSSLRASSCTVYGEGLAAEGDVGEEETEPLRAAGTYVYTLECETDTGDIQTARTRVEVR